MSTSLCFLEREDIISESLHHARRRRVVLQCGKKGSGKTELLKQTCVALSEHSSLPPVIIYRCTPYKQFLLDILYQLHRRSTLSKEWQEMEWEELYKKLNRAHSRETLSIIYSAFESHDDLILAIDNIDTATPQAQYLIRHLLENEVPPVLLATITSPAKVDYLTWQGEILHIAPLSSSAVTKIVNQYVTENGLKVQSIKSFRTQIYNISAGNPLAVANLLKYCRYEPVIKRHLLSGRDRSSGRQEIDMSWLIILFFVGAMMTRYLARAVGDTHLYMMASIGAALTIGGRFILFRGGNKAE